MPEPIVTPTPAPEAGATSAPEGEAKPGAATPAEETYTVKINGEERKMTRAQIIEAASRSEGATAAMKQAAEVNKAFSNFVAQAQNPEQLLTLLQHPSLKYDEEKQEVLVTKLLSSKSPRVVNAVKKWIYDNEIAPKLMDPKEREIQEKNERLAKYEKDEADRKASEEQTKKQLAVQKAWNDYRVKIGDGLKAEGLPATEATVARVARYALLQSRAKKEVDVADCVKRVKADLVREHEERYQGMDDDKILDMLPEKLAERIHKAYLKRLTKNDPASPAKKDDKADEIDLNATLRKISRGQKAFE